jgi:hypothetical protein
MMILLSSCAIGSRESIGTDPTEPDALMRRLYRGGKIGGRLDRDHVPALSEQNVLDDHGSLLGSGRGWQKAAVSSSDNEPPRGSCRQGLLTLMAREWLRNDPS